MHVLIEFILNRPEMIERLLNVHQSAPDGRCRGCTKPGTGIPWLQWPCAIHYYASQAAELRARPDPPVEDEADVDPRSVTLSKDFLYRA